MTAEAEDDITRARMNRELDKLGERMDPVTDAAVETGLTGGKVSLNAMGDALAGDLDTLRDQFDKLLELHGLKDDDLVVECPSSLLLTACMQSRQLNDNSEGFLLESLDKLYAMSGATLLFVPLNTPDIDIVNQKAMIIGRMIHHAFLEIFDRAARVAKVRDEIALRQTTRDICAFLIRMNWRISGSFTS